MRRVLAIAIAIPLVLFSFAASCDQAQQPDKTLPKPSIRPAIDGVIKAFAKHPLVAIGDSHGSAQEEDFYAALIRDPRFAKNVGNVVVEFGAAAHQDTIDRYVNGEDVPYAELRKVWTDVVGWVPTVLNLGYMNFFAQVRATNLALPSGSRIHVWLGEPPIDWFTIKTKSDFDPIIAQRNPHAAEVIEKKILDKDKKALVIYGGLHFYDSRGLVKLVEKKHPGAFFLVMMYSGYVSKPCTASFEQVAKAWPQPALVFPVRKTALETLIHKPGCDVVSRTSWTFPSLVPEFIKAHMISDYEDKLSGISGDALLYLGPAANLTESPKDPTIYLDPEFRKEISRRMEIMTGQPLSGLGVDENPVSPQYVHH